MPVLLRALSGCYCALAVLRRQAYRHGLLRVHRLPVPVAIVGNVTVGGTGKTPLVLRLVELLRGAGFSPGIVSRGYGGEAVAKPRQVDGGSDPALVGDEPVLLARRSGVPVWVGSDRVAAALALLRQHRCDVVVCDDGLQHYRLHRDVEVAVIDGTRSIGNGRCLPAGPLREPAARLDQVDLVVTNGPARGPGQAMTLVPGPLVNLADPSRTMPCVELRGATVHGVAGTGNPSRFFALLRSLGMEVIEHAFPDHYRYRSDSLSFGDCEPILMTEKDAVKCERLRLPDPRRVWFVPVEACLVDAAGEEFLRLVRGCRGV